MSARCPYTTRPTMLGLTGSLFLAISGSTVLNMWYDRDIDANMPRTSKRPLPTGKTSPREALIFGLAISALGVGWAFTMDTLFGLVVFAGLFFDVIVYTVWLKRRTAWSIVWGGISGGMPILAGRVLGVGQFDWIGVALSLAILFWIPTHILTFSMRYHNDYQTAGVPTFPSTYGFQTTRVIIAVSSRAPLGTHQFWAFQIRFTLYAQLYVVIICVKKTVFTGANSMKKISIFDRILLLITGLLAAYQIVVGCDGLGTLAVISYTIAFGVLLVAGLLLIIMGFEVLDSPLVVIISTVIPLSLSLGLVAEYLPGYVTPYFIFVVVGFLAIVITRFATPGKIATIVLAVVHGVAGMLIFLLPIILSVNGTTPGGFALVGVGGAQNTCQIGRNLCFSQRFISMSERFLPTVEMTPE